ncbi:diguanylate cyclase domain-containing protein [Chakrabartyella piscis]|uniref:sensor domain-containing diguanylate cyclase n=1 Tax=Chakrabartyella piscis TaxID=2918914 RepID=UPI002958C18C|nr:diguanylate cyclase [Chakrabartyella piscis]
MREHNMTDYMTKEQFQAVVRSYPEPTFIVTLDDDLTIQFGNEAFYAFFGVDEKSFWNIFQGKFRHVIEASKQVEYKKQLQRQFQKEQGFCLDIQLKDALGQTHFASFSGTKILKIAGEVQKLYCRLHRTDEKHALITELENEKFFFQTVQTLASDLLFRYFIQQDVIHFYGNFRDALGLETKYENYPTCLLQKNAVYEQDFGNFMETLRKMNAGEDGTGYYRAYDRFGKALWLQKEWKVLCDDNGKPKEVIGRISNIQNQKEMEEQINVDTLTGCLRKKVFEQLATRELKASPEKEHTVFIVDLDHFKAINDNLGHQFGDMVLADVGQKLRDLFRTTDYVGRIGGDEFMVFMKDTASHDSIVEKANTILQEMDRTFQGAVHTYRISASVGIATYPKNGFGFQELYEHADVALFDAKNRGKNAYVFYDEKLSKGTMENTMPYDVATRAMSQHFDAKVISGCFNLLFETNDLDISLKCVLQTLGSRFGVSRVYIFERSKTVADCYDNTYEWCADGIESAMDVCQNIPKETFQILMKQGNEEGIIYCNDVMALEDEVKEILDIQDIKSFLHAYTYSGEDVVYAIGFDDCSSQRIWSPIEISTLLHASKIIVQFLNYKGALEHTKSISEERLGVMDSLNYFSYIVDQETYKLSYFNAYTKGKVPHIQVGDVCYKVLRGLGEVCTDCPLAAMKQANTDAIRLVLSDTAMGKYMLINASKLKRFEGKKSMFVAANDVTDVMNLLQPEINTEGCSRIS